MPTIAAITETAKALRLDRAVAAYRAQEITLSRAAELASLSTWDFLALMPSAHLQLHNEVADFEDDIAVKCMPGMQNSGLQYFITITQALAGWLAKEGQP